MAQATMFDRHYGHAKTGNFGILVFAVILIAGVGYAGSQLLFATSRRFPNYWIGAYVRHDWLAGAVFDASPLVQQHSYWAGGAGFVWMIRASSTMVDSHD